jgi:hypothetical protein
MKNALMNPKSLLVFGAIATYYIAAITTAVVMVGSPAGN